MEEIRNKQSVYEEPELKIVYLAEMDIITTSGEIPQEGEFVPAKVDNLFR